MEQSLWPDLDNQRVLLAVSGGIAAYKAAEICRLLNRCGAKVQVLMTRAAQKFVGEATFAALSGIGVGTSLWDAQQEATIGHIDAADHADLLVLAPCTANLLASMAHGLAHDMVTTVYLAFAGPVLVAPAMNVQMWAHPATQHNAELLRERGNRFVGPEQGEMACGHVGAGRMAEPQEVLQAAGACLAPQDLRGRRLLVTAGGTREAIDPVRFVANRSTGKMGFAIAAEAAARGAEVTLIAGPTHLPEPWSVEMVRVGSAAEMGNTVDAHLEGKDAIVMAAAVADFTVAQVAAEKLKKESLGDRLTLELVRTRDILASLGERFAGDDRAPLLVGFAAETAPDPATLADLAEAKLARKRCDLLVANDVSANDAGFASDTNRVVLFEQGRPPQEVPLAKKRRVAGRILARVAERLDGRSSAATEPVA
ncbi:MAG: bifunctional phosphopantothenoylcysteine decarboxylase/phosphopantothenate--cysteine ligase CoaBC [Proteobacteria bacterium]|nr:MAG: bifunctional phosphopantothenoylcysteine decarboxylase/phosphopantothenate--cysteine ligase CoaBC [Pseudomonadota bacterium]PIE19001.1 MAG: bifunctional phosphopantothenoylcysteine decarboxylase/phosphopantothenate--cysteine ligase CoaBC [Pseudomonadota bacterium]